MADRRIERAQNFLDKIMGASAGTESALEGMATSANVVEAVTPKRNIAKEHQKATKFAAAKFSTRSTNLTPIEQFALEAIIIPDKRPAIDIIDGDYTVAHDLWLHLNEAPAKDIIRAAIPSVGRVELPGHPTLPYGGTGFVVGNGLLMTNRHVAEIFCAGVGTRALKFRTGLKAGVDFGREIDDEEENVLAVRRVMMIHPYWDMALLSVEGLPADHPPLKLSLSHTDDLINHDIAVIGYPAFDPRNDAKVQNQVFNGVYYVKRLQPGKMKATRRIESFEHDVDAATHDSSTLGGNSGSLVLHVPTGQVLGLHFAGVYLDANYAVPTFELARDSRVVDAGVTFAAAAKPDKAAGTKWWRGVDQEAAAPRTTASAPPPPRPPSVSAFEGSGDGGDVPPAGSNSSGLTLGSSSTWTIPVQITVTVGGAQPSRHEAVAATDAAFVEKMVAPKHDDRYETREGYREDFLGVAVPLPDVTDPDVVWRDDDGSHVVPYHHFSLAMHKERRLALFTASNVDYRAKKKKPDPRKKYDRKSLGGLGENDQELWFEDTRIPSAYQLPDRFFTKDKGAFDKGHLVRREDVAWGDTYSEVRAANGDTFHTTNCSPQVAAFNRPGQTDNWGNLEQLVGKNAKTEKLCVFAGPVLADDDKTFVGVDDEGPVRVKIPSRYWKVITAVSDGELQSFGFLLKQDLDDVALEFMVDSAWRRYMIPIGELEEILGHVEFPDEVKAADQAGTAHGESVRAASGIEVAGGMTAEEATPSTEALAAGVEAVSWRVAKSLLKLRSQVDARSPNRRRGSDGTIGDTAHQNRSSDHNPWVMDGTTGVVTAMDITHDPANGCNAGALAEAFRLNRDARIKYVIWNRHIMSATVAPWTWRPYNGANPHNKHVHISVKATKAQYDDVRNWNI